MKKIEDLVRGNSLWMVSTYGDMREAEIRGTRAYKKSQDQWDPHPVPHLEIHVSTRVDPLVVKVFNFEDSSLVVGSTETYFTSEEEAKKFRVERLEFWKLTAESEVETAIEKLKKAQEKLKEAISEL